MAGTVAPGRPGLDTGRVEQLRPGIFRMDASGMANTYLVDLDGRVLLVDPGMTRQLNPLAREFRDAGRSPFDVTDLLLTHYDFDHTQAAAEWARRTGATTWMSAVDAEILRTGRVPDTPFRRFVGWFPLPELPTGLVELSGEVEIVPGLVALPAPGHTPGSYAFVVGDVAFIGDAAQSRRDGELRPMAAMLMSDVAQGDATRAMLTSLPVRLFCTGHTTPTERAARRP